MFKAELSFPWSLEIGNCIMAGGIWQKTKCMLSSTEVDCWLSAHKWTLKERQESYLWCFSPLRQLGLIQMFCSTSGDVNPQHGGGEGAPQEIKANSIIYLLTMTKPFHSSALHRMCVRGGGGRERRRGGGIKSVNIFNECNYWIISHTVHLLQSVPVTRERLKYCFAFLHSYNHINTL